MASLLKNKQTTEEKVRILTETYGIPFDHIMEQEMKEMCNFSDYVEEKGRTEERETITKIIQMIKDKFTNEDIVEKLHCDPETVKTFRELVTVS